MDEINLQHMVKEVITVTYHKLWAG